MNVSELFPLWTALGSEFKHYYINRELNQVYSTKRPGQPHPMTKTGTGSCRYTYWSLSTGQRHGNFTIRVDELARKVLSTDAFRNWKNNSLVAAAKPTTSTKGFIVGTIYVDGRMSFAAEPKVHATEASAIAECERLARSNNGNTFIYLEIKGKCKFGGVSWN